MNQSSITIKIAVVTDVLSGLKKKGLKTLRQKLLLALPDHAFKEGSQLWREQQNAKGLDDIKHGRYKKFSSREDLQKYLDSLK